MALVVKGNDFEEEVLKSEIPVLVDFFATWCGPCKMIAKMIDDLSGELDGKAKVVKVDIDEATDVVVKYGIRSVPTLMFFQQGEVVEQVVGAVPKDVLLEKIEGMM